MLMLNLSNQMKVCLRSLVSGCDYCSWRNLSQIFKRFCLLKPAQSENSTRMFNFAIKVKFSWDFLLFEKGDHQLQPSIARHQYQQDKPYPISICLAANAWISSAAEHISKGIRYPGDIPLRILRLMEWRSEIDEIQYSRNHSERALPKDRPIRRKRGDNTDARCRPPVEQY